MYAETPGCMYADCGCMSIKLFTLSIELFTHSGNVKSKSCGQMRCSDRRTRTSRLNSKWVALEASHMRR